MSMQGILTMEPIISVATVGKTNHPVGIVLQLKAKEGYKSATILACAVTQINKPQKNSTHTYI